MQKKCKTDQQSKRYPRGSCCIVWDLTPSDSICNTWVQTYTKTTQTKVQKSINKLNNWRHKQTEDIHATHQKQRWGSYCTAAAFTALACNSRMCWRIQPIFLCWQKLGDFSAFLWWLSPSNLRLSDQTSRCKHGFAVLCWSVLLRYCSHSYTKVSCMFTYLTMTLKCIQWLCSIFIYHALKTISSAVNDHTAPERTL